MINKAFDSNLVSGDTLMIFKEVFNKAARAVLHLFRISR
jgi:hypothetical protein